MDTYGGGGGIGQRSGTSVFSTSTRPDLCPGGALKRKKVAKYLKINEVILFCAIRFFWILPLALSGCFLSAEQCGQGYDERDGLCQPISAGHQASSHTPETSDLADSPSGGVGGNVNSAGDTGVPEPGVGGEDSIGSDSTAVGGTAVLR